jgi:enoyl-CoA hydratase/carnithine racemase
MMTAPVASKVSPVGILEITLRRPERRNAISTEMGAGLRSLLQAAEVNPDVQLVVLRGEGECFCGGADVVELRTATEKERVEIVHSHVETRECWRKYRKPTLAAVSGPAVGLGCVLVLQADFVVASETASFSLPEARLGHSVIDPQAYIARFGLQRANQLLVACQQLDAREAHAWGFVNYVARAGADFEERVDWLASEILKAQESRRKLARHTG